MHFYIFKISDCSSFDFSVIYDSSPKLPSISIYVIICSMISHVSSSSSNQPKNRINPSCCYYSMQYFWFCYTSSSLTSSYDYYSSFFEIPFQTNAMIQIVRLIIQIILSYGSVPHPPLQPPSSITTNTQ